MNLTTRPTAARTLSKTARETGLTPVLNHCCNDDPEPKFYGYVHTARFFAIHLHGDSKAPPLSADTLYFNFLSWVSQEPTVISTILAAKITREVFHRHLERYLPIYRTTQIQFNPTHSHLITAIAGVVYRPKSDLSPEDRQQLIDKAKIRDIDIDPMTPARYALFNTLPLTGVAARRRDDFLNNTPIVNAAANPLAAMFLGVVEAAILDPQRRRPEPDTPLLERAAVRARHYQKDRDR
jgi:hypothetical protein